MGRNKVLLTGCAGFIGSHLAESLLEEGYEVVGLDNFDPFYDRSLKEANLQHSLQHPSFRFVEGDIRDREGIEALFREHVFDAVFHLAAKAGVRPSLENPGEYIDVNIRGTERLLTAMKAHGVRNLLFASSSSVYGEAPHTVFREDTPLNKPISVYASTKLACEHLIHTFHHLYGIAAMNVRYFTVYGPRQRPDLAINKFSRAIFQGTPIQVYGDGSSQRDYTFVRDIVRGTIQAYAYLQKHSGLYEIVNLGNSNPVTLEHLIASLEEALGKEAVREYVPAQPGDVSHTYASIEKARERFGYAPKTPLKEGLKAFSEWMRQSAEKERL